MAILQSANVQLVSNLVDQELIASNQTAAYTADGITQVDAADAVIDLFDGNDNWDVKSNPYVRCYVNISDVAGGDVTIHVRETSDSAGSTVVRQQEVYRATTGDVGQVLLCWRPVERYVHVYLDFSTATGLTLGDTASNEQPGAFFTWEC